MNFNDLLSISQIKPESVIVVRHRPFEPELAKVLPWLAAEQHEVFNAYQQTQSLQLENALLKMRSSGYLASFLAHGPARALFVGLYAILESRRITEQEYWDLPAYKQLKEYGIKGFNEAQDRPSIEMFNLSVQTFRSEWKGKLVVDWPGGERSWWRRAENNDFAVHAILEDSALTPAMPEWNTLCLTWEELKVIPSRWKDALRHWRGIYYIHDAFDCKAYVGSAGGAENLLGRWLNYADSGHGSNKLLKGRDPKTFRFSILERVSPDMNPSELVDKENSWKVRLATRHPFGLNDN